MTLGLIVMIFASVKAQQPQSDTVIVELGKSSRVIFTLNDRSDLDVLKNYNFQALFEDILEKLENSDSSTVAKNESEEDAPETETRDSDDDDGNDDNENEDDSADDNDDDWEVHVHRTRWGRTWQSFNFDLGTNNYLSDGKFPDDDNALYSVRPWGSWYFAANSIQRTRLARKFFIEWGIGISWYTFKFQNDNILIEKDDTGVQFIEDVRDVDFKKSKLSASYVTASLIPVVDFRGHGKKPRIWDGRPSSFRIGVGPYVGYRIGSHSKIVYEEDGDREKDKNKDSFYLNNFRYGARLQIGFRSTDLFFNYDFNELFSEGKGPSLNAFSFGVVF